ncbi:glycosyltransferase family 17 protein [Halenospora varia]|nr:glycosyltransferase family 17 protein [Halenospora varia]
MLLPRYTSSYRRRWQYLLRTLRLRWREVTLFTTFLWLFLLYNDQKHPFTHHPHTITPESIGLEFTLHSTITKNSHNHGFLPLEQATTLCALHNWQPYPHRDRPRKIYDLFMLNDELDWLEIRLHTLFHHIDYFIVLESNHTFTGLPKPLTLASNWARFSQFHSKLIYHEVQDMPLNAPRPWDLEDHQRNAMFTQVIPRLTGPKRAEVGDVLVVSDVDEIPRPVSLTVLRECRTQRRVTLRSQFYYYGFQWLHRGEQRAHPQATVFAGDNTILPADLRNGEGGNRLKAWWDKTNLWNAGWHCSTCFSSVAEVLTKLKSFSHIGLNQERFRDRKRIVDRVRKGMDLWDRDGENYDKVEGNEDIPGWLKENRERFGYLLDRDGMDAGFRDVSGGDHLGD